MLYVTDDCLLDSPARHQSVVLEGSVILTPDEAQHFAFNVLTVYKTHMEQTARDMRQQAAAIRQMKPASYRSHEGTISLLPQADAIERLAVEFDGYVDKALVQITELQGPDE